MKTFISIDIFVEPESQNILSAYLSDLNFIGFEELPDKLVANIHKEDYTVEIRETVFDLCERIGVYPHQIIENEIEEVNWNRLWEESIQPQEIGVFVIHPTWNIPEIRSGQIPVIIDPKMAFGTGYHATTRLLLRMLPDYIKPGFTVLDAGTGTGVLALASAKLGAVHAFGFDIDEWSKVNADENAELNDLADSCTFELGSLETVPSGVLFDVVLANINRNVLLEMIPELIKKIKPGGYLLLSGLLQADEQSILEHPGLKNYPHLGTSAEGEWISLVHHVVRQ